MTFDVLTGPNAGATGGGLTDANGQVTFTYTGAGGVGDDSIEVCVSFAPPLRSGRPALGVPLDCDTVAKTWIAPTPTAHCHPSAHSDRSGSQHHAVANAGAIANDNAGAAAGHRLRGWQL